MDYSKLTTAEIFPAFIAKAQELFNYLIFDFEYEIKSDNCNANTATIIYTNDVRALVITLSPLDNMIYYTLRKVINGKIAEYADDENSILIDSLIIYIDPTFSLIQLQPVKWWDFEDSLRLHAKLLKQYCSNILDGTEWISPKEVSQLLRKRRRI